MRLYLVVDFSKSTGVAHSVHVTLDEAEAWCRCKLHDGCDAKIVMLFEEAVDAIRDAKM